VNTLIIGNKNYSSWSLRSWIVLKEFDIPFEEVRIPLFEQGYKNKILKYSPTGKVPVFCSGNLKIWDFLAICEYLAGLHPDKNCWPADIAVRAIARSVSHEMHSGFFALRNSLPMNCKKRVEIFGIPSEIQTEIDRICEIWQWCREQCASKGPFLFGRFSIADAMEEKESIPHYDAII